LAVGFIGNPLAEIFSSPTILPLPGGNTKCDCLQQWCGLLATALRGAGGQMSVFIGKLPVFLNSQDGTNLAPDVMIHKTEWLKDNA
jgi:hypothetical protein